jgi:hypothetical protein
MKRLFIAALDALICRGAQADEASVPLKPGAVDDVVSAYCSACHISNYIVTNSIFLTPDRWKAEVIKMRTAFGAPIDDATGAKITAYLAAHYTVPAKP